MDIKKNQDIAQVSKWERNKWRYIFSSFFGLIAIGLFILGIYLTIVSGVFLVFILFGFIVALFGFIAFIIYPANLFTNSIEIQEDRLFIEWKNDATGEQFEESIHYRDIDEVLFGIYQETRNYSKHGEYYVIQALMIMRYQDKNIMQFFNQEDLRTLIEGMTGKVPIRYTDYDLSKIIHAKKYVEIDMTMIDSTTEDIVSEHVGKETLRKNHTEWMPEELAIKVKAKKKEIHAPKTRRAETRTFWILLGFNLLYAAIIFPYIPLDGDGIDFEEFFAGHGYFYINALFPMFYVFWRSHTKWFTPLLYVIAGILGNVLGIAIATMTNEILFNLDSFIKLNLINSVIWVSGFAVIKGFKVLFPLIEKLEQSAMRWFRRFHKKIK